MYSTPYKTIYPHTSLQLSKIVARIRIILAPILEFVLFNCLLCLNTVLTLFYTRGLEIVVSHVMVPLPNRFSL